MHQVEQLPTAARADQRPAGGDGNSDQQAGTGAGDGVVDRHLLDDLLDPGDLTVGLGGDQGVAGDQFGEIVGVGFLDVDVDAEAERPVGGDAQARQDGAEVEGGVAVERR